MFIEVIRGYDLYFVSFQYSEIPGNSESSYWKRKNRYRKSETKLRVKLFSRFVPVDTKAQEDM